MYRLVRILKIINIYIKYSINRTSTPALAMQLFPPQTTHYLPLLLLLPLQLASASLPHLVLLAFNLLLRPNTTQNYCNAAASLLVSPLILLLNFYDASLLIYSYAKWDLGTVAASFGRCRVLFCKIGAFGWWSARLLELPSGCLTVLRSIKSIKLKCWLICDHPNLCCAIYLVNSEGYINENAG